MPGETTPICDEFTLLFERVRCGDHGAAGRVYQIAFPRLHHTACALLKRHRSHLTLQPTALVNELYVKLRGFSLHVLSREHFHYVAARAMRQLLTDRGRKMSTRDRNLANALTALYLERPVTDPETRCAISKLLRRMRAISASAAHIVELHYFEGHTWGETAAIVGMEEWRVRKEASFALTWMRDYLA